MVFLLLGMVDVIFADVAQPDQARIVALNAHSFLKNDGFAVMSIKVNGYLFQFLFNLLSSLDMCAYVCVRACVWHWDLFRSKNTAAFKLFFILFQLFSLCLTSPDGKINGILCLIL